MRNAAVLELPPRNDQRETGTRPDAIEQSAGFETTRWINRGTHYDIYLLLADGTESYIGWHKEGRGPGEIGFRPVNPSYRTENGAL